MRRQKGKCLMGKGNGGIGSGNGDGDRLAWAEGSFTVASEVESALRCCSFLARSTQLSGNAGVLLAGQATGPYD
jgi:hypothetical protein